MMPRPRKSPIAILLVIFLVLAGASFLMIKQLGNNKIEPNRSHVQQSEEIAEKTGEMNNEAAPGVYKAYSAGAVADAGFERTILFFHAPWCPQCRAFEQSINAGSIPAGTQILKADYDSSTDLKKKHGVTLQTTFVQVDKNGNQLMKWVGYTSDHTLKTLLEQFGG